MMHMTNNKINFKILVPIFLMAIISIVTIYSALTYTSKSLGNLALKQAVWYIVGSILVIILLRVKNSFLEIFPETIVSGNVFYFSSDSGSLYFPLLQVFCTFLVF